MTRDEAIQKVLKANEGKSYYSTPQFAWALVASLEALGILDFQEHKIVRFEMPNGRDGPVYFERPEPTLAEFVGFLRTMIPRWNGRAEAMAEDIGLYLAGNQVPRKDC